LSCCSYPDTPVAAVAVDDDENGGGFDGDGSDADDGAAVEIDDEVDDGAAAEPDSTVETTAAAAVDVAVDTDKPDCTEAAVSVVGTVAVVAAVASTERLTKRTHYVAQREKPQPIPASPRLSSTSTQQERTMRPQNCNARPAEMRNTGTAVTAATTRQ
jgi:hypothetical protein